MDQEVGSRSDPPLLRYSAGDTDSALIMLLEFRSRVPDNGATCYFTTISCFLAIRNLPEKEAHVIKKFHRDENLVPACRVSNGIDLDAARETYRSAANGSDKLRYRLRFRMLLLAETPLIAKNSPRGYDRQSHPFDRFLEHRHFSHSRALGAICRPVFAYISY